MKPHLRRFLALPASVACAVFMAAYTFAPPAQPELTNPAAGLCPPGSHWDPIEGECVPNEKIPPKDVAAFDSYLTGVIAGDDGAVLQTNYDRENEANTSPVGLYACRSSAIKGIKAYVWSFSDPAFAPVTTTQCSYTWHRPLTHESKSVNITLTVQPKSGPSFSVTHTVTYRDVVIASIGDSAAAGTGAPEHTLDAWPHDPGYKVSKDCDRSGWAASAQAALAIQRQLPNTTVHFWHLACAGARITADDSAPFGLGIDHGGLTDWYTGPHQSTLLPPQLLRLDQLVNQTKSSALPNGLPIDRLVMSIGANDLEWALVAESCVPFGLTGEALEDACLATWLPKLKGAIAAMPTHFIKLDKVMSNIYATYAPRNRVFLVPYFDPVDSLRPQPLICLGDLVSSYGVRRFAADSMMSALQGTLKRDSTAFGWNYVAGVQQAFQGHGTCDADPFNKGIRWINSAHESMLMQGNAYSTWHANRRGQGIVSQFVFNAIRPGL